MSDRGPDNVKSTIRGRLDEFLDDESPLKRVPTKSPPVMTDPGPVTPYPVARLEDEIGNYASMPAVKTLGQ